MAKKEETTIMLYHEIPTLNLTGSEDVVKRKKAMLMAYEKTMDISKACELANITRTTHYTWCGYDEVYKNAIQDMRFRIIDMAQANVYKKVKAGQIGVSIWALKTLGKHLGYTDNPNVAIQINNTQNQNNGPIWQLKVLQDKHEKETAGAQDARPSG